MSSDIGNIVQRLETVTRRLEEMVSGTGSSASISSSTPVIDSEMLNAFNAILSENFQTFLDASQAIGGDVATQGNLLNEAFIVEREFLAVSSKSGKPSDDDLRILLNPLSNKIQAVMEYREKNRHSEYFNHLSAISESASALGWISVTPTPGPFVKEMSDASQFYTNRVLKDFKEKDATHSVWVKSWLSTLRALQDFIKQYHTTGITWCADAPPASSGSAAGGVGGPPPPPPPPPPIVPPAPTVGSGVGGGDEPVVENRAALFSQINQGDSVTKGLKKVSDDMKTHKNPELRKGSTVPQRDPNQGPVTKPGAAQKPVSKPPKMELENNKWIVEFHVGNKNIVISETEIKHTVYVYQCQDSTIQVKGKINSIVLDNCKKCALVAEDLISAIDIINCQSVQTQVMGIVPTVNIDKTDGVQVYLSKDSCNAQIVSAKSSEMNILIPDSTGEYKEYSVPEQFKTIFNGTKLVTECSESV